MLDERGRLFGLINVIDLVVVLLVLAVAGIFLAPRLFRSVAGPSGLREVRVTVLVPAVREPTVAAISPGVRVVNTTDNSLLGTVVSVNTVPASVLDKRVNGTMVETTSPVYKDDYVTLEGPGTVTANGVTLGKTQVRLGAPFPFSDNVFGVQGTVWSESPMPAGR